jgi:hypothetical protein
LCFLYTPPCSTEHSPSSVPSFRPKNNDRWPHILATTITRCPNPSTSKRLESAALQTSTMFGNPPRHIYTHLLHYRYSAIRFVICHLYPQPPYNRIPAILLPRRTILRLPLALSNFAIPRSHITLRPSRSILIMLIPHYQPIPLPYQDASIKHRQK